MCGSTEGETTLVHPSGRTPLYRSRGAPGKETGRPNGWQAGPAPSLGHVRQQSLHLLGDPFSGAAAHGQVADLASGAVGLPVEVEMRPRNSEDDCWGDRLPDEVQHRGMPAGPGGAKRQPGNGAHMVLELAGLGPLDRPVAGVVNPGSHLVGNQLAA